MSARCLYCYKEIEPGENDYHAKCSRKMFGVPIAPILPYTEAELDKLAEEVIRSQISVTGVQAKLSLHLQEGSAQLPKKFTIVGLWGGYILKPPTPHYQQLPEVEDLTMHLAEAAGLQTVPHCLVRLASGNLAYLTKRVDRTNDGKLHMEDMCQLTERLTEDKYRGSYEQVARTIRCYSAMPGLDIVNFYELVLFCFLTGNADMHLKNFSLLQHPDQGMVLSPAYDLVATTLVNPADNEELALTLNAKKRKIKRSDFEVAFKVAGLDEKQQRNIFNRMKKAMPKWKKLIDSSFLSEEFKQQYIQLLAEREERMYS